MVIEILEPHPYGFKNARDSKQQGSSISRKIPFAIEEPNECTDLDRFFESKCSRQPPLQ
jgi:hypothetical protein